MLLIFSDYLVLCHGMPQPDLACPGIKGIKKGRAPDIGDVRVGKVTAAGESGISLRKRLLNTCILTMLSTRRVADNANCSNGREMCETLENTEAPHF